MDENEPFFSSPGKYRTVQPQIPYPPTVRTWTVDKNPAASMLIGLMDQQNDSGALNGNSRTVFH